MTSYRYVGIADVLSLGEEDFTRHGIDDQGEVTFNEENNWTVELSDAAAEYLRSQGFQLMSSEDYDAFLEEQRAEVAREAVLREATPTVPPTPRPADLFPKGQQPTKVIPARPAANASRDELADYAWTHYMIPVETAEHKMTKAEINTALDEAGATDEEQVVNLVPDSAIDRDEQTEEAPVNEGVATDNVNTT